MVSYRIRELYNRKREVYCFFLENQFRLKMIIKERGVKGGDNNFQIDEKFINR